MASLKSVFFALFATLALEVCRYVCAQSWQKTAKKYIVSGAEQFQRAKKIG